MKRNFWKKTAAGLLSLMLVTGSLPANTPVQDLFSGIVLTAHAAEAVASGFCGDSSVHEGKDVTWTITENPKEKQEDATTYTLTISGSGAMENYIPYEMMYIQGHCAPYLDRFEASIKSIIIEDGVTHIGESAFYECENLTSVTISDSVTSIGEYAFSFCSSLSSVDIPESVAFIGAGAFCGCSSLISAVLPENLITLTEGMFDDCQNLKTVNIPDGVEFIPNYMFFGCKNLASVSIPDSVTSIGKAAFAMCESLT
ncbi:MAG: leucine-rich repeat domain-containing protein, partial [Oscillospiraceae bacterium]|nr:leucine-rich repeat domain-containing protein [Oscillospiraceae bacterium]